MNTQLLQRKIDDSKKIIRQALDRYAASALRVAWTGGKDSTLVLWLVKQVCEETESELPICFCIDEGDMFDEVREYISRISEAWNIRLVFVHNDDVSEKASEIGDEIVVAELNERNRREIERLGWDEETFFYEPESYVGNHLMKTVACMTYIEDNGVEAFFEGIRWDEQGARADEQPFSPRPATEYNPEHMRINPILHFTERDVWDAFLTMDIPICSLYERGYRSLGAKVTTKKLTDTPAWEQDLENTTERGGRRQDKEGIMKKLRDLGYM
jgi:phosphoadenosine phosphosulfate reductase